ncbi:DUF3110 domain-containing protein [Pseudanabaena mucicola]|uniref:DUF3110 domain-containing protein n=1 Tax=Pseudanabaena mucicola FACHB-723 TaxID=2692860 RepID=A0ABR7ZYU3_9CYAN|nr:DUF3110 domain-containing protein [Pseudanabaena mucicola]MBD2189128.1 DUF3110 domain-containing protein [Pseudanabaena mucicola FACHB-723]
MQVWVLPFNANTDNESIYTLEVHTTDWDSDRDRNFLEQNVSIL